MHNFKDLKVWQMAVDLAVEIHTMTGKFPRAQMFNLTNQMNRSSESIASNIAEGSSRNSKKDFNRFLEISAGSAFELETQLIVSHKLKYVDRKEYQEINEKLTVIQKMIYRLQQSLDT